MNGETSYTTLVVPDLPVDCDILTAAFAYIKAGWYVGPLIPVTLSNPKDAKNPGSILGKNWHLQTSRDPEQIAAWFAGASAGAGIFLHVGRSGGVVLDIDHFFATPKEIRDSVTNDHPPIQSTRPDDPGRFHAVYTCPSGRLIGNSKGRLSGDWGEVRGLNGVIVAYPTPHPEGGRYAWLSTGPCPVLSGPVADALPEGKPGQDAASDAHVALVMASWAGAARPDMVHHPFNHFDHLLYDENGNPRPGASRHEATVDVACWIAREARAGFYPLSPMMERLRQQFVYTMSLSHLGSKRVRDESSANHEFAGIVAWAVSQAESEDITALIERITAPFNPLDSSTLVPPDYDPRPTLPIYEGSAEHLAMLDPESEERQRVFDFLVGQQMERLRVSDEARRRLRSEGQTEPPTGVSFADLRKRPRRAVMYRIDDVFPAGTKIILAAQRKTGKTTLVGNLIRSLVDGDKFLDTYVTHHLDDGVVGLLDFEMDPDMIAKWLDDQGIQNDSKLVVHTLRGFAASFDIVDNRVRAQWVQTLRAQNVRILVIDCLRPILDSIGLDENREAGRFLVFLDSLLSDAGIDECVLVHHAGHGGERSRGDSRLRDWPDVEWRMVRATDAREPDKEPEPGTPRFFIAEGRDVLVTESELHYDGERRHLSLSDGNRRAYGKDKRLNAMLHDVVVFLRDEGDSTTNAVAKGIGKKWTDAKDALLDGVRRGLIGRKEGPRGADIWFLPNRAKLGPSVTDG